jgi:hypothetical protein
MKLFEQRNQHSDRLANSRNLRWMGQDTSHHAVDPESSVR